MALITIPAIPEKGTEQQYSLSTTELFALVSDSYFTDQNNLRVIEVVYQSSTSNQIEVISFIPNGSASLISMAEFAATSRNIFDLVNVVLVDKQNGRYQIGASEIPNVESYQVDFTPAPTGQYVRVFSDPAPTEEYYDMGGISAGVLTMNNGGGIGFIARFPTGPLTSGSGQAKVQLYFKDNIVGNSIRVSYNTGVYEAPTSQASMQAQVDTLGYAEITVNIVNSTYYFNSPSLELRNVIGDSPSTAPVYLTQIIVNKI